MKFVKICLKSIVLPTLKHTQNIFFCSVNGFLTLHFYFKNTYRQTNGKIFTLNPYSYCNVCLGPILQSVYRDLQVNPLYIWFFYQNTFFLYKNMVLVFTKKKYRDFTSAFLNIAFLSKFAQIWYDCWQMFDDE